MGIGDQYLCSDTHAIACPIDGSEHITLFQEAARQISLRRRCCGHFLDDELITVAQYTIAWYRLLDAPLHQLDPLLRWQAPPAVRPARAAPLGFGLEITTNWREERAK